MNPIFSHTVPYQLIRGWSICTTVNRSNSSCLRIHAMPSDHQSQKWKTSSCFHGIGAEKGTNTLHGVGLVDRAFSATFS